MRLPVPPRDFERNPLSAQKSSSTGYFRSHLWALTERKINTRLSSVNAAFEEHKSILVVAVAPPARPRNLRGIFKAINPHKFHPRLKIISRVWHIVCLLRHQPLFRLPYASRHHNQCASQQHSRRSLKGEESR
jgi:hypothetical protein